MVAYRSFCLALLIVLIANGALALTDGEKEALDRLLHEFPELGYLSPPWTSNVSEACGPIPFQGLNCSDGDDPHVTGLYESYFSPTACTFHFDVLQPFPLLIIL